MDIQDSHVNLVMNEKPDREFISFIRSNLAMKLVKMLIMDSDKSLQKRVKYLLSEPLGLVNFGLLPCAQQQPVYGLSQTLLMSPDRLITLADLDRLSTRPRNKDGSQSCHFTSLVAFNFLFFCKISFLDSRSRP